MTAVQRKVSPALHQRRKGKSSVEISMLMATDGEEQTEGENNEMKIDLEDQTKVDSGPLTRWENPRVHPSASSQGPASL